MRSKIILSVRVDNRSRLKGGKRDLIKEEYFPSPQKYTLGSTVIMLIFVRPV